MDHEKPDPWWPLHWTLSLPNDLPIANDDASADIELPGGERLRVNHSPRLARFNIPPIQVVVMEPGMGTRPIALLSDMVDLRCFLIDRAYPTVMPSAGHA